MSPTAQMPQETGSDTDFRERPAEDDEEETEEDLSGEVSDPALLRDALDRSGRGVRRAGSRRSDKQGKRCLSIFVFVFSFLATFR